MTIKLQRTKNLLTVKELRALGDGVHSDGDRLRIVVKGGRAKADQFRDMLDQVDADWNSIGVDPLDARDRQRAEATVEAETESRRRRATLVQCARSYHERVIEGKRSTRHAAEWISSIERHIPKAMLHTPVDEITAPELFDVLSPLQTEIPETAGRVRQRLEKVLADAEFRGLVKGNAAGAIADKLKDEAGKRERTNYRALPYTEVPAFMTKLREHTGVAHRLMEFTILTACRTNESRMMVWPEVDLERGVWTIPGPRMKARTEHIITLSPRALEIVRDMRKLRDDLKLATEDAVAELKKSGESTRAIAEVLGVDEKSVRNDLRAENSASVVEHAEENQEHADSGAENSALGGAIDAAAFLAADEGAPEYVFPSLMKPGKPLSAMAMLMLTRKMGFGEKVVPHGFRSSFSDFAYSTTPFRSEVIESALAHTEAKGSKVKRAYLRTNFERDCAVLLHLWHDFVLGVNTIGNVIPMQAHTQPIAPAMVANR